MNLQQQKSVSMQQINANINKYIYSATISKTNKRAEFIYFLFGNLEARFGHCRHSLTLTFDINNRREVDNKIVKVKRKYAIDQ